MANIKSQKKRVLTNEKAHLRNVAVKSGLKTAIRATREAIAAGDKAAAEAAYKVAAQKLDKAAGRMIKPYSWACAASQFASAVFAKELLIWFTSHSWASTAETQLHAL